MPPITVKLDIVTDDYRQETLKVDNVETLNSIFPDYESYGVTEKEFSLLKKIAKLSGDSEILENSDLAIMHMAESMKKGNLEYEKANVGKALFGALVGEGWIYEDKVTISGLNPEMTLGEAEKYFGLRDGALKFNYTNPRTDYKQQRCAEGTITLLADDFPGGKEYAKVFCEKSKEYKK